MSKLNQASIISNSTNDTKQEEPQKITLHNPELKSKLKRIY